MPIDTREKRNSAQTLLVPIWGPGIAPSSIDQAERQAAALVYVGISASVVATVSARNQAAVLLGQRPPRTAPKRLRARIHRRPH